MVTRPVIVPPWQQAFAAVKDDGTLTESFQRFLYQMWLRTGGFDDDFSTLAAGSLVGQIGATERATSQTNDLRNQLNLLTGQIVGTFGQFPPTRVITFTQDDVWRLNPDVRSIQVYCLGGGGGGGGGRSWTGGIGGSGGGGGGGGGYSYAAFDAALLPASVAVVVGAGGVGGGPDLDGASGNHSEFGTYIYANGGDGGGMGLAASGSAGDETPVSGNLFQGGAGGAGSLTAGASAPNSYNGAPGGGGGGGVSGGSGGAGAAGAWRTQLATGGGGEGGASGSSGDPGESAGDSDVYLGPAYGGGGGGGATSIGGNGGDGGDGVVGSGGGGGGAGNDIAFPGNGGNGGNGRVWVVEYY